MDLLVFLQNSWQKNALPGQTTWLRGPRLAKYTPEEWEALNYKYWFGALSSSHSGKRLFEMLPEGLEHDSPICRIAEASPFVGSYSGSKFPMDREHCVKELNRWKPQVVLLCGGEAHKVEPLALARGIRVVKAPHPAHRLFSKQQALQIKRELNERLIFNQPLGCGDAQRLEAQRDPQLVD